jgi:hypothetical protein
MKIKIRLSETSVTLHGVTIQKTTIDMFTAVRLSDLTQYVIINFVYYWVYTTLNITRKCDCEWFNYELNLKLFNAVFQIYVFIASTEAGR